METQLGEFIVLRGELAAISTPAEALLVRDKADKMRKAYELMNRSVGECNKFAEIYLAATWKFGDLIKDRGPGAPEGNSNAARDQKQTVIGNGLFGSEMQRKYARKIRTSAQESDIADYVRDATADNEQASIAGLLEWLDPGRHGNLKGEYEWYTPPAIINAVRNVLGEIDLDPASCELANEVVKAKQFYSEENNGLEQQWHGRVFINPPFAHPIIKHFADKLAAEFKSGEVEQAIWLSNACVDVGWWHELARLGQICFYRGRIKFGYFGEPQQSPTLGQSIFYLGKQSAKFRQIFSEFGVVVSHEFSGADND